MSNLPEHKIEKLIVKVIDDLAKTAKESYRDLRTHEVPAQDAFDIVKKAANDVYHRVSKTDPEYSK